MHKDQGGASYLSCKMKLDAGNWYPVRLFTLFNDFVEIADSERCKVRHACGSLNILQQSANVRFDRPKTDAFQVVWLWFVRRVSIMFRERYQVDFDTADVSNSQGSSKSGSSRQNFRGPWPHKKFSVGSAGRGMWQRRELHQIYSIASDFICNFPFFHDTFHDTSVRSRSVVLNPFVLG